MFIDIYSDFFITINVQQYFSARLHLETKRTISVDMFLINTNFDKLDKYELLVLFCFI